MTERADPNWVALAEFVRDRREELGLTVIEAAQLADVSESWWHQLERPARDPAYVMPKVQGHLLGKAAKALDVPLADLRAALNPPD